MKVSNLINANGNANANQFIIEDDNGNTFFQSYESTVCKIDRNNKVTLGEDWNYSTTTSKHLYEFLKQNGHSKLANRKAILKAIKSGELAVIDL